MHRQTDCDPGRLLYNSHEQKVSGYRDETKHDAMTIFQNLIFSHFVGLYQNAIHLEPPN